MIEDHSYEGSLSPVRGASRVTTEFFRQLGVEGSALSALAEMCWADRYKANHGVEQGSQYRNSVLFVLNGSYMEIPPAVGPPRLWGRNSIIGDIHRITGGIPSRQLPRTEFLSDIHVIGISVRNLRSLSEHFPSILRALLHLTQERLHVLDEVYSANRKSPLQRVATLLDYLADSTPRQPRPLFGTDEDGTRTVIGVGSYPCVVGPTQADIADALGLGRATVEKAVCALRNSGALITPPPGARRNRMFEIQDRPLLVSTSHAG